MSLDVYLYPDGNVFSFEGEPLFRRNITHNLGRMAEDFGLYVPLWRPEEAGIVQAWQLIPILESGLRGLRRACEYRFSKFEPENGWGTSDSLSRFTESYLYACKRFPTARVKACR